MHPRNSGRLFLPPDVRLAATRSETMACDVVGVMFSGMVWQSRSLSHRKVSATSSMLMPYLWGGGRAWCHSHLSLACTNHWYMAFTFRSSTLFNSRQRCGNPKKGPGSRRFQDCFGVDFSENLCKLIDVRDDPGIVFNEVLLSTGHFSP